MQTASAQVSVQTQDFEVGAEYQALRQLSGNAGAIACFSGLVREFYNNDASPEVADNHVASLYLEHYPGMTQRALQDIVDQACQRWQLLGARVVHRVGELSPGDQIVFVAVASAHRGEAFAAAEFIMDYLKTRAPFWKKQRTGSGESWIESRQSDQDAASRW